MAGSSPGERSAGSQPADNGPAPVAGPPPASPIPPLTAAAGTLPAGGAERSADPAPVRRNVEVPEGLWIKCLGCGQMRYRPILEENLHVCPDCDYHYRVNARTRINQLNDPGTFEEFLAHLESTDPLEFRDRMT